MNAFSGTFYTQLGDILPSLVIGKVVEMNTLLSMATDSPSRQNHGVGAAEQRLVTTGDASFCRC